MSALATANDTLVFPDTASPPSRQQAGMPAVAPWTVIIVDDDPEVHAVIKLALTRFDFAGRGLSFVSAYSGAEAKQMIANHPNAAVMLLDVVMEEDHSGLDVVRHVRETLENKSVRIVLRTGQPGQAPEREVIRKFDINDYKEKTELTSQKLFTLMHACLRSYRDIAVIEASKHGLEKVIEASADVFEMQSVERFTCGVMEQLVALLSLTDEAVYCRASGLAAASDGGGFRVLAGSGDWQGFAGLHAEETLDKATLGHLRAAHRARRNIFGESHFTGYFVTSGKSENLFHVSGFRALGDFERHLVELFSRNVGIGLENLELRDEIESTQKEVVYRLGEAVETRSQETGNHVKIVAEISRVLGLGYGLSPEEADILRLASPLHDVGKIGIPDHILNKPGKLDAEEWEIMKTRTTLGYDMLKGSTRPILEAGAHIALEHHEKWDGSGYPNGKRGEEIHVYGRITALSDVFDALGSERCYKPAWELDCIFALLRAERGAHFDPRLIDVFFERLDEILAIRAANPDSAAPH